MPVSVALDGVWVVLSIKVGVVNVKVVVKPVLLSNLNGCVEKASNVKVSKLPAPLPAVRRMIKFPSEPRWTDPPVDEAAAERSPATMFDGTAPEARKFAAWMESVSRVP